MHISLLPSALLFGAALAAPTARDTTTDSDLTQFYALAAEASANQLARLDATSGSNCTSDNIVVRKEWGAMSETDRKAYTDAVLCLQSLSPDTPAELVPGARSRYDDFVATHMNQTLSIHETGSFLSWHRWMVYTYEQSLKTECGYNGTQPYWNWGLYASDPASSPLFDGSDYSMGGNGEYVADRGERVLSLSTNVTVYLEPGTGGGCVTSGPFKDMVVNLGPMALPLYNGSTESGTIMDYNPRCLVRDVSADVNTDYANSTSMLNLITQNDNLADFQNVMQGAIGSADLGVHGGGHYTIGGNPADDVYISPGDPMFYLHHGMIDLMWWLWQNLDIENRQFVISGTRTFEDYIPSGNATLDDLVDIGYAGGYPIAIRELTDTIEGPLCYTYEF